MNGLFARARSFWSGLRRPGRLEADMDEEMRFHIEMEAERLTRERGVPPGEARRQAAAAFGGRERYKEEGRDARGLTWVSSLSIDLKLGVRMMRKYPGLTLVGGLGMALSVAIATFFFDVSGTFRHATLPFHEGERVIAIENRDAETNEPERRILHDFAVWREGLTQVADLGAWRPVVRNLVVPGGPTGPVPVAEMTASGFRAARVPPVLGRTLVEEDEAAAAPPVAVIGHDVWQTRFGGAADVVGREVRLGDAVHTVVGVMPEGFGFPVNHGLWVPLRADASAGERRAGLAVYVFGRLAPGATAETAQAELATTGLQMAAAHPETHRRLRPRVVPYTLQFQNDMTGWEFTVAEILVVLLLVVICVNVAVLVYARTVTRVGEIAVRGALGASRRRIVAQFFAEALVLSLGAAAVGLAVAELVLHGLESVGELTGGFGFWIDFGLSPGVVLRVVGLAVLGAVIVGVLPAIKATGRPLRSGLSELGGATGVRLGRTWTALIVAQVAIAVAVLPAAVYGAWNHFRYGFARPAFAAEVFLTARMEMDTEPAADGDGGSLAANYGDRLTELLARLEAEPTVTDVTFASSSVGGTLPASITVEGVPAPAKSPQGHSVRTNHLDVDFFDALGVPLLAGRAFRPSDTGPAATAVVVNHAFVDEVLGGRNALGRQIQYAWRYREEGAPVAAEGADSLRWYEIVGVVSDMLVVGVDPGESEARVYHPTAPGQLQPMSLALRMRSGDPADFTPRLREIASAVDPGLQLHEVLPLDESLRQKQGVLRLVGLAIALMTLSVVLLSAAGMHALLSFTVVHRRKEIGIRSALGAHPRRLLANIFSRVAGQLAVGLVIGTAAAAFFNSLVENLTGEKGAVVLSVAALLMVVVGLLAALGPARRGLRIQPMEALRTDG